MNPLILSGLSYSYRHNLFTAGSTYVLHDINLTLSPGEITYILGPNGAGKSTLVNCITGITAGYKGEITIPKNSRMGALLDQPFVYPSLTAQDNIRIFLRYNQLEYSDYHDLLNQYLEIDELLDKRFKKMSQGQRQRVLLFIAMINDPDILFLDEPFNGLDPFYTEKLIALLLRLREDNRIILINDHIISHTMRLADQVAFLIRHELIYVMQPALLEKGLYYALDENSDSLAHASTSFSECVQDKPLTDQAGSVPISNLTELYTLAVNHGKTKVV